MLKLRIHGIKDGNHNIELEAPFVPLSEKHQDFFGQILVKGLLSKLGNRFTFNGEASCKAKLVCDISAEEYIEDIKADINLILVVNTELYFLQKESDQPIDMDMEIALHEADEYFDMTKIVYDELILSLPVKNISPNYRGKNFEECFPQYSIKNKKDDTIDDRWAALKNIDLN